MEKNSRIKNVSPCLLGMKACQIHVINSFSHFFKSHIKESKVFTASRHFIVCFLNWSDRIIVQNMSIIQNPDYIIKNCNKSNKSYLFKCINLSKPKKILFKILNCEKIHAIRIILLILLSKVISFWQNVLMKEGNIASINPRLDNYLL